jgi:AAA+ superfamily predicted ATPase
VIITDLYGLLPLLQRLDALIERATAESSQDNEVGKVEIAVAIPAALIPPGSRLAWLQQTFGLSDFDLDLVAIALAPELDRRYDRLYAYLQDDARCKRPTVDLVLNLLCDSAIDKLANRIHFAPDSPLIRQGLLHLIPDPNQAKPTLLGHELHLDDQIIRFLLHQPGLDPQLMIFCEIARPIAALPDSGHAALIALAPQDTHEPLRLYFQGSNRPGKRQTAEAVARAIDAPLLITDLPRMIHAKVEFEPMVKRIFREAELYQAVLYLDGLEVLQTEEYRLSYQFLLRELAERQGITILTGESVWRSEASKPLGVVTIAFPLPDFSQRRQVWKHHLERVKIAIDEGELDDLSERFRLTFVQIADAVVTVMQQARLNDQEATIFSLFAAARAQAGHRLGGLAKKIEPIYGWDDIVLPAAQRVQLRELCNQAKYRHVVYGEWGYGEKLSLGKGLNVLFSGLPGTGKTMGAEVIAHELQLDLYKIDLSQIVSKYIGETEKNLDRIFTTAANSNAILLFDEADALFGKRSEVQNAHDRYANIEVGYLLQKMEEYEGIAILTTNMRSSLDDAFVRRLQFIIDFPLPNESDRLDIWQKVLPTQTPRSEDLDLGAIARRFELSGAHIRNIALAAAFLAAGEEDVVTMNHLIRATQREYQKMGKLWMEGERGN